VQKEHVHQTQNLKNKKKETDRLQEELRHLEAEEAGLMAKYRPLVARLEERKAQHAHLQQVFEQGLAQTRQLAAFTHGRQRESTLRQRKQASKNASDGLQAQRGYNMKPKAANLGRGDGNCGTTQRKVRISRGVKKSNSVAPMR
jgi:hypothetical protein